jgi:hypothetical protein
VYVGADTAQIKTGTPFRRWLVVWGSLSNVIGFVSALIAHRGLTNYLTLNVGGGFLSLALAVCVGIAVISVIQGLVLRYFAPNIQWWAWTGATFIGYLLGFGVATICFLLQAWSYLANPIYSLYEQSSVLPGYILGIIVLAWLTGAIAASVQARVLKGHIRNAAGWIIIGAIALQFGLFGLLLAPGNLLQLDLLPRLVVVSAFSGTGSGIISGIALVGLLRQAST